MEFNRHKIKQRIKYLKDFLPYNSRNRIIELHPEYNTPEGKNLIKNVFDGRTADYRLLEILEKIASDKQKGL